MRREERLIEAVIGNLKLLRGVSPSQSAAVAAQSWTLPLARGQALVRREQRLPGVCALAYGVVKLSIPARTGLGRVVRLVAAGQSFGESAAVLARAVPYEAVAVAHSKVVVIPSAALFGLIERDARLARAMLLVLAERNLGLLQELQGAGQRRGLQRLAAYVDSLAEPAPGNGAWRASLPGTKTLVASRLGMSKETLSRLLGALARRGVIEVSRHEIIILDRSGLTALFEERG